MSTYSNIKMGEIFVIYGNPFSRKRCSKNLFQVLCVPYYKRVNFTSKKKKDSSGYMNKIKDSFFLMGRNNSKVNLCNNSNSSHNTNTNMITNINRLNSIPQKPLQVSRKKTSVTTDNIHLNELKQINISRDKTVTPGEITNKNSFKTNLIDNNHHGTPINHIHRNFGTLQSSIDKNFHDKTEDNTNVVNTSNNNDFLFSGETGSVMKIDGKDVRTINKKKISEKEI